jgi:hypothetical protein
MGQASVCRLGVANRFACLRLSQASIAAMITIMTVTSSAVCHAMSQTVGAASACGLIRVAAQAELVSPSRSQAPIHPLSTRRLTRSTRRRTHPAIAASCGDIGRLRKPKVAGR